MKRRFADARENDNIIESDFINYYINDEEFTGNISVLKINKVKEKWLVDVEDRCILNNYFIWIEVYPEGKNYCITVMCDENKNIVEWYFDICKQNGIEDGVPFEDDLYLDVVIVPDGRLHILDEDELIEAYNNKFITKEELQIAYKTKDEILEKYETNIDKLKTLTERYIKELLVN